MKRKYFGDFDCFVYVNADSDDTRSAIQWWRIKLKRKKRGEIVKIAVFATNSTD